MVGGDSHVEGVSDFFLSANREKRSLAIDLKHPDSKGIIRRFIERPHVLVENSRPVVLARLGYGLEEVRKIRPDIIYVSAAGYGSSGPMQDAAGQDILVQARSGMIAAAGAYGEPPVPAGNAFVDQHGATQIAMGIAAAHVRQLRDNEIASIERPPALESIGRVLLIVSTWPFGNLPALECAGGGRIRPRRWTQVWPLSNRKPAWLRRLRAVSPSARSVA